MITVDPDAFSEHLAQKLRQNPALHSVQYAMDYRCNLACVHCYAEGAEEGCPPILSVAEVRDLFRQFAELGCLHCTVTGGEPLLCPDFEARWTAIAEQGIRRLLFTNATRVDDRVAAFLRETPPDWVEVTLLGADSATHDALTRHPGSFEAALAGIRRLERAGVRARVKTMVMRGNAKQIGAIRDLAATLGDGSFRLDGQLMGDFRGRLDIASLRVSPEDLVELEYAYGDNMDEAWGHEVNRLAGFKRERLYACGAAKMAAYLSPWGDLHPCLSAAHRSFSVRQMPVREAWAALRESVCSQPFPDDHPCRDCNAVVFCQNCPAVAQLDVADENGISPFRCALAKAREIRYHAQSNQQKNK